MATLVENFSPLPAVEGPGVRDRVTAHNNLAASTRKSVKTQTRQRGYTYLLVLFLVAAIGAIMGGVGQTWQARAQREKEAELIAIGVEFAHALHRYQDASPEAAQTLPKTLEVLVEDRRFPKPQRHLRRIYHDPITGKAEWGIERNDAGITGIYSLSDKTPFRRHALPPALGEGAAGAQSYRQWVFRPIDDMSTSAVAPTGNTAGLETSLQMGGAVR